MQAVILAGGKGTRLAERLNGKPKPLVDVGGKPLLQRQLEQLAQYGIDEALVLVNHAADQIEAFFQSWSPGFPVHTIDDGDPRGTAGAVLACMDRLQDRFLVVYGDTLFDIDIDAMVAAHEAAGAEATLLLHPNDHPADSDLVEIDEDGAILAFHGYPHPAGANLPNLVNAAFYCIEKSLMQRGADLAPPLDFAKDYFPAMLKRGAKLHGYSSFEYIKDLGTPKRLDKVERHLASGLVARARRSEPQAVVFVDRDGTLNELRDYVRTPDDLVLIDGVGEAIHTLNDHEYRVIVLTNQPVIARGECTFEGLRQIHAKLDMLLGEHGGYVDRLYFCPHHPHSGYEGEVKALKFDCDCRKPKTGMIDQARAHLNIDQTRSWLIGDSTSDARAAQQAGLRFILVETGEGGRDGKYAYDPSFTAPAFPQAVAFLTKDYPALLSELGDLARAGPGETVLIEGADPDALALAGAALAAEARARGLSAQRYRLAEGDVDMSQIEPTGLLILEAAIPFSGDPTPGRPLRRVSWAQKGAYSARATAAPALQADASKVA